ncbi:MAG: tRNA (N6-threonylcarbamoyladenosine(37)-N6)-methyltransferase TrmO [Planctomycetota bacterium]
MTFTPIGVFRTRVIDKAVAPRQSGLVPDNEGRVELEPEYHAALAGLEGFDRVWLITWLDRASGWRPIVTPPRANEPLGLFATRAPHRPNPIGLSAVRVERIEPGVVFVRGHDVIEGTPILDLKPYLPSRTIDTRTNSASHADRTSIVASVSTTRSKPSSIDTRSLTRSREGMHSSR